MTMQQGHTLFNSTIWRLWWSHAKDSLLTKSYLRLDFQSCQKTSIKTKKTIKCTKTHSFNPTSITMSLARSNLILRKNSSRRTRCLKRITFLASKRLATWKNTTWPCSRSKVRLTKVNKVMRCPTTVLMSSGKSKETNLRKKKNKGKRTRKKRSLQMMVWLK